MITFGSQIVQCIFYLAKVFAPSHFPCFTNQPFHFFRMLVSYCMVQSVPGTWNHCLSDSAKEIQHRLSSIRLNA